MRVDHSERQAVAVTGDSGRLGWYVVNQLMQSFNVRVVDLYKSEQDVDFLGYYVLELAALKNAFEGVDAVVHLAAIDSDHQAASEDYIHVDVEGTWNVLQAAQEQNISRVLLSSSVSVCGLSEANPNFTPQYLPADEIYPEYPIQAYSVSKPIMENMAVSFVRGSDMEVLCLRPTMVLTPDNIAPTVELAKDTDARRLFYYITPEDCAKAFEAALLIADGHSDNSLLPRRIAAETNRFYSGLSVCLATCQRFEIPSCITTIRTLRCSQEQRALSH